MGHTSDTRSRTTQDYRGFTLRNRTHRANGWFISYNGRVRWGTRQEIHADVDHLLTFGKLPNARRGWA